MCYKRNVWCAFSTKRNIYIYYMNDMQIDADICGCGRKKNPAKSKNVGPMQCSAAC